MSSYNRRTLVLAALGVGALSACGFTPAYGPQGSAGKLQGMVALPAPQDRDAFLLQRRLEERLGRGETGARYALALDITTRTEGLGSTADGRTTRFQLIGTVDLALTEAATGAELSDSTVTAFVGYSATGSTVATLAAERDAQERLMTILADKIVDRLVLLADTLP